MKKATFLFLSLTVLCACNRKQLHLTRASFTDVELVDNHSPVYFEVDPDSKEMVVNQDNRISNTNYIMSVQRDLNIEQVAQKVMEIKQRKYDQEGNMHADSLQIYYSYADTLNKNLAFFGAKEIDFGFQGPSSLENLIYVKNKDTILVQGYPFSWNDFKDHLPQSDSLQLGINAKQDFETYLQVRLKLRQDSLETRFSNQDLVY